METSKRVQIVNLIVAAILSWSQFQVEENRIATRCDCRRVWSCRKSDVYRIYLRNRLTRRSCSRFS